VAVGWLPGAVVVVGRDAVFAEVKREADLEIVGLESCIESACPAEEAE
jgi:hypothetical protein